MAKRLCQLDGSGVPERNCTVGQTTLGGGAGSPTFLYTRSSNPVVVYALVHATLTTWNSVTTAPSPTNKANDMFRQISVVDDEPPTKWRHKQAEDEEELYG